ncbi:MAG TPA: hypothetical protein VMW83_11045 [Spirochaetia bacterium]|nr:hypothetical protein [Spirochaetia bacterium]
MPHRDIDADAKERWLDPGLLRWIWLRYRWVYLGCALAVVALMTLPGAEPSGSPSNTFIVIGMCAALFGGVFVVGKQLEDGTVAFLTARPVSRRQIFNTLVLAGLVPWLLFLLSPAPYTLVIALIRPTPAPAVLYRN